MRRYIFMLAICLKMIHNKKRKMKDCYKDCYLLTVFFRWWIMDVVNSLVLYLLTSVLGLSVSVFLSIPCFSFSFKFSFNFRFSFSVPVPVPILFCNPFFDIQPFHALTDNLKRYTVIKQNF